MSSIRSLLAPLAAAAAIFLLAPSPASAGPAYCVANYTNATLDVELPHARTKALNLVSNRRVISIGPNRRWCCQRECRRDIRIGVEQKPKRDHRADMARAGLTALKFLFKVGPTPSGASFPKDPMKAFCKISTRSGDEIELIPANGAVRCDVVGHQSSSVRYSGGVKGRVATPAVGFNFCNKGRRKVWTSVGWRNGRHWSTAGWYGVEPGRCTRVPLANGYRKDAYWYAMAGKTLWKGQAGLCAHPTKSFRITSADGACRSPNKQLGWRKATFSRGRDIRLNLAPK